MRTPKHPNRIRRVKSHCTIGARHRGHHWGRWPQLFWCPGR